MVDALDSFMILFQMDNFHKPHKLVYSTIGIWFIIFFSPFLIGPKLDHWFVSIGSQRVILEPAINLILPLCNTNFFFDNFLFFDNSLTTILSVLNDRIHFIILSAASFYLNIPKRNSR